MGAGAAGRPARGGHAMTLRTRLQRLERHTPAPATACTLSDCELAQIIMGGRLRARQGGRLEEPSDLSDADLQQIIDGSLEDAARDALLCDHAVRYANRGRP